MPIVESSYTASGLLRHGHLQTVLGALLVRPVLEWQRRERLELEDGDFLDLDHLHAGHPRLAILSHGLEGSSQSACIRATAAVLSSAGWDVTAWNFRGCSGEPNRLARSYHSGESGDLRRVVNHLAPGYPVVALAGFSLGGNITLKYLAEKPPHPAVRATIAVSAPVDLTSSARVLDEVRANLLYRHRFLRTLRAKMFGKSRRFPDEVPDPSGLPALCSFREFDDRFTAPLHGFAGAEDYWKRASSLPLLESLSVPSLLLNARNDPMLAPESHPTDLAAAHPLLHLESPEAGGHTAFPGPGFRPWYLARIQEFLDRHTR